jgi:hypothetical protein
MGSQAGNFMLRILIVTCLVGCASGCINYPRTHVLVTPIAVAGVHSFAPAKSKPATTNLDLRAGSSGKEGDRQIARTQSGR